MSKKHKVAVFGNDSHFPFHDKKVVRMFVEFIGRVQPDVVGLLGDIGDCYSISRFDKRPDRMAKFPLRKEIKIIRSFLQSIRDVAPNADIKYVKGNHEARLEAFLMRKAPELYGLDVLSWPSLLGLKELNIKYYDEGFKFGSLYCTHGSVIRKHGGYTARAEFEKNGCSGISGHSHRDGAHPKRNRGGVYKWWENFCMCDLDPEYIDGVADWTQGFSYVTLIGSRPHVVPIAVINGRYVFAGKEYK
jgi:predicted phosphodiesterase